MSEPAAATSGASAPSSRFFERGGRRMVEVHAHDRLEPFLLSVVSSSDAWMFLSSVGPLTAGRGGPASALFPYTTDDKLHDSYGVAGPLTAFLVQSGPRWLTWEPFDPRATDRPRLDRRLAKTVACDAVTFEETHEDHGLRFRATWEASERYGWIRRVAVRNLGDAPVRLRALDGAVGLMPADAHPDLQAGSSNLLDAYRLTERVPGVDLAALRLSSIPIDQPRPNESLRANTALCIGLEEGATLLSKAQVAAFLRGAEVTGEPTVRGRRAAFLKAAEFTLPAGGERTWTFAFDVEKDGADVADLTAELADPAALLASIHADLERCREDLWRLVASADGVQLTGDPAEDARHHANTLCNIMRGGVFPEGHTVSAAEFGAHVTRVAPLVAERCAGTLASLPDRAPRQEFLDVLWRAGDDDLTRLGVEYMPLTFSRRHGDPSRPWNTFHVPGRRADGARELRYEGNWRDIFQNWEALCTSFPAFAPAAVTRFLNASTADGYNPYRITDRGVDWEVHDPDDPWSFIGYWGDHQVVYLARLVDLAERSMPGSIAGALERDGHVFVDVPYRIAGFEDVLADPHSTITFDDDRARAIDALVETHGNEGRLLRGADGTLVRATLAEKLLTPILVKLTNLVPGGGVWMNTQRPEWNDANNAIAGLGLSVVTTAHLHAALGQWSELFADGPDALELTPPLAALVHALHGVLVGPAPEDPSPAARREATEQLGRAGESHRRSVYAGESAAPRVPVPRSTITELLASARRWTGRTIEESRRDDGLFHSYNLMGRQTDGGIGVRRLVLMLEGQVAVLSSGALDAAASLRLLEALRASPLYRPDQRSYVLYPDRDLPSFLDAGVIDAKAAAASAAVQRLLGADGAGIVRAGSDGTVRFAPAMRDRRHLASALERAAAARPGLLEEGDAADLQALYEATFDHDAFPGRSMSFFGYEGLGSVYWHMVSKLILAAQDQVWSAPDELRAPLVRAYEDLRAGLGTHRSPADYGAFPSDPYSHTPMGGGARQPGLTGQVKEDFLSRMAESGLHVEGGHIRFRRGLAHLVVEGAAEDSTLRYLDARGAPAELPVPAGAAAITFCGVPVVLRRGDGPRATATLHSGEVQKAHNGVLDAATSASILARGGRVARIDAWV